MRSPLNVFLFIYLVLELIAFYWVCEWLGILLSIVLIVLSSIFGSGLLRLNGVETMYRAQQKAQQGEAPAAELLKGFAISFGAILMIIPGFITSILGLLLIIPGTRRLLASLFIRKNWFRTRQTNWNQQSNQQSSPHSANDPSETGGRIIDGDFKED